MMFCHTLEPAMIDMDHFKTNLTMAPSHSKDKHIRLSQFMSVWRRRSNYNRYQLLVDKAVREIYNACICYDSINYAEGVLVAVILRLLSI